MEATVAGVTQASINWLATTFNTPFAEATVFGVDMGGHLFVEGLLFLVILYLFTQKSYKPPKKPLTEKEIDELCNEWTPESLIPAVSEEMHHEAPVLESAAGPHTTINGEDVVNFASANYLGLIGQDKLLNSSAAAIEKYGVGSCGPRQFYGTIDVHVDCEARIAKFLGTPGSALYSHGLPTNFSVIPTFSKRGDVIVADEGVHWGIQNGLYLSRSTVVYFKHNDIASLEGILKKITSEHKKVKKICRRYIVIESVYQNSGQIAPLDDIIRLKERYRFRIVLDESNSFGVLGSTGRGLTEYFGVPIQDIDILTANMGHALATDGGFCTGSARVIDHQRLNSTGYIFTASLPPYLASAAISAIDVIEENPTLVAKLKQNVALLWAELEGLQGLEIASNPRSPIVFLRMAHSTGSMKSDLQLLEDIADRVLKDCSVLMAVSKRSVLDKCSLPVGIRLFVSAAHSESDLSRVARALKRVAPLVLGKGKNVFCRKL